MMLDPLPTTSIHADTTRWRDREIVFSREYEADNKEDDMKNARVRSPILDSPSTTQGVAEEVNGVPVTFAGPHPPSPDPVTNPNPSDARSLFDDGLVEAQEDPGIIPAVAG
jgi:hypothetical protein